MVWLMVRASCLESVAMQTRGWHCFIWPGMYGGYPCPQQKPQPRKLKQKCSYHLWSGSCLLARQFGMPGCLALKGVRKGSSSTLVEFPSPPCTRYATDARHAINAYARHDGNAWNVMILASSWNQLYNESWISFSAFQLQLLHQVWLRRAVKGWCIGAICEGEVLEESWGTMATCYGPEWNITTKLKSVCIDIYIYIYIQIALYCTCIIVVRGLFWAGSARQDEGWASSRTCRI